MDAYDLALCLIPVALMVKTVLCLVGERRDRYNIDYSIDRVSSLTIHLIRFNGQLATAFTIVFVLILTTFLRRLALWKVQTGEFVARLEQNQTSMSLISTLRSILALKAFDSISVGLVVLWSFYYLGSQASKDEYEYQVCGSPSKFNATFRSASAPSAFQNASFDDYHESFFQTVNLQYGVYVVSNQHPADYTGSVVVPFADVTENDLQL